MSPRAEAKGEFALVLYENFVSKAKQIIVRCDWDPFHTAKSLILKKQTSKIKGREMAHWVNVLSAQV